MRASPAGSEPSRALIGWLATALIALVAIEVGPLGGAGLEDGELHPWWHTSSGFSAVFGLAAGWALLVVTSLLDGAALAKGEEREGGGA